MRAVDAPVHGEDDSWGPKDWVLAGMANSSGTGWKLAEKTNGLGTGVASGQ